MKIEFTKMSGAGNDFIVLGPDYASLAVRGAELARRLCERRSAIGADGLIIVDTSGPLVSMHYFNADGSEAAFCGNGARCLVLYCQAKGIAAGRLDFRSGSGDHMGELVDRGVRIRMDAPHLVRDLFMSVDGKTCDVSLVRAGVPHAVILVDDVSAIDVARAGRAIRHHGTFAPEGANVDFVETGGGQVHRIRTYERGVERETLACGTGCVAAACVLRQRKFAEDVVSLTVGSGDLLTVELPRSESDGAYLVGPAVIVFEGQVEI